MHAKIEKISIGRLNGYRMYFNSSSAQIISDLGCNVNSLILDDQDIIDGNTNEKKLSANYLSKSSLLIPFPNRIEKGKYAFEGKTYQLPINKEDERHAIHGLVFDKKFSLISTDVSKSSISASFYYEINNKIFPGYPFNLAIVTTFTLKNKMFSITITATNKDAVSIPYGAGWHPYLKLGKKIDYCYLNIPSTHILEISKEKVMIPTGRIVRAKNIPQNSNIGSQIYDTCFTKLKKFETEFGNITLFQDKSMNYLQVYTPEERASIAIESMSCAPNAFNNGMGLILIKPLGKMSHSFALRVN